MYALDIYYRSSGSGGLSYLIIFTSFKFESPLYCACVQVGWCQAGGVVIFTAEVTLVQGIYWILGYWAGSHPSSQPQHYDVAKK